MNRRRALVVTVIAAAGVCLGLPAWAYFTVSSTTVTPSVSAGSIGTFGTVSVTTINSTATLSWPAPTAPTGATVKYTVDRTGGGVSATSTCTGSLSSTTCTDNTLTPGTSYTWTVVPHIGNNWNGSSSMATTTAAGALSKFAVTLPATSTAGDQLSMTVQAQDSLGDRVTGYAGTVAFSSTDSQAVLPANYTFLASDSGQHTFTNGVTFKTKGNQKATATDGSVTGTSAGTVVSAAAANKLVFATSPAGASAATTFTTQPVVNIDDQYGNLTSSNAAITLAIGTNPASGTLTGCTNLTASGGVVTVTGCKIDKTGTGYTLKASSTGLNDGTSTTFDVKYQLVIANPINNATGVSTKATISGTGAKPTGGNVTLTFNPTLADGTTTSVTVTPTASGNWSYDQGTANYLTNKAAYTITVSQTGSSSASVSFHT